eukprot:CAMPEP_0119013562 /NCGR_PEP_ID=MMETSP1176-20130426/8516_1 /TAXON_ID=265551 /ORGANISM="Synedropsis recta cf, Strain CCMP1620" /LENGTH=81 /DNA_ID=CAMNT_0006966659 /DNA_START=115 /DNA_END=360 /DNA_ORIENTATION=-
MVNARVFLFIVVITAVVTINQWMRSWTEKDEDMRKVGARANKFGKATTNNEKHQEIKTYMREDRKDDIKDRIRANMKKHQD